MSLKSRLWKKQFSFPLSFFLFIDILILSIALLFVFFIPMQTATQNTQDLLLEKSELLNLFLVEKVTDHLQPVEDQVNFLSSFLQGTKLTDEKVLSRTLKSSLAAAPQLLGTVFVNADGKGIRAFRGEDGRIYSESLDFSGQNLFQNIKNNASQMNERGHWAAPIFAAELNKPIMNYRKLIYRNNLFVGFIGAAVSTDELSKHITENLASIVNDYEGQQTFILYGRDKVLAHANLIHSKLVLNTADPLASISEIQDNTLANIWSENRYNVTLNANQKAEFLIDIVNDETLFIYSFLRNYGPEDITVGIYFPIDSINKEIKRLDNTLFLGILLVLFIMLTTYYVGRKIKQPITKLSETALAIREFKFHDIPPLKNSIFSELNDANMAFNAMLGGLRSFDAYVPTQLVNQLMHLGDPEKLKPEIREITVMFTDLASFTQATEQLTARKLSNYLNQHLSILTQAIEDSRGTVDKYLGDGLMAIWGAPEAQDDHAQLACEAAIKIANDMVEDIEKNLKIDCFSLGLRIGIYTGKAIVGNVGTKYRLNYTAIGDTVNTAAKLQAYGKQFDLGPVRILIGESTFEALEMKFKTEFLGEHYLGGRNEATKIYQLIHK